MKKLLLIALCILSVSSLFGGYEWEYTNKTLDTLYVRVHGGVWPGRFDRKKTLQPNQTQTFEGIGAYCRAGTDVIKAQANKTIDNINNDEWDKNQIAGARCGSNKYYIIPKFYAKITSQNSAEPTKIINRTAYTLSLILMRNVMDQPVEMKIELEPNKSTETSYNLFKEGQSIPTNFISEMLNKTGLKKVKAINISGWSWNGGSAALSSALISPKLAKGNTIKIYTIDGYEQVDK